jgi:molybdopterin synthase sulfur carrier subunit
VRLFGAARAAAGTARLNVDEDTLQALIANLSAHHGPALARVLARCSFLIDGLAVHDRASDVPLPTGCLVDVLPPYAGG